VSQATDNGKALVSVCKISCVMIVITEMTDRAVHGRKRTEVLHDVMENRNYGISC